MFKVGNGHVGIVVFLLFSMSVCNCKYITHLDPERRLWLEWYVDYDVHKVLLNLTAYVRHENWFAFGFSDDGDVKNADLVGIWKDKNHTRYFQDMYTDKNANIHVNNHQTFELIDAYIREGRETMLFTRFFNPCNGGYVLDKGTTHLVYLIGTGRHWTLTGINANEVKNGFQRVQLLKPNIPFPSLPQDAWDFKITAPNVEIPGKDTTYWWYITTLPPLNEKHHIIRYEPIIDQTEFVHHMEVFHCEVTNPDTIPQFSGPGLGEGKPPGLEPCRRVIGAWAMGAGAVNYPQEAGAAIGGHHFSPVVLLEVHYNNPSKKTGYVDSSGIRFTVTRTLRPYDVGIMELGLEYTNKMAIPPQQEIFALSGYCISECTYTALSEQNGVEPGITVFASQLHTHLTGKRVYTKHVRAGKELPELNRDNHYSPHFQEIRVLPFPVKVLPGDALITTCEYNTKERNQPTIGGFSIQDEMCVNYIHYYPKVDLEVCKSSIQTKSLNGFFHFINKWENQTLSLDKGLRAAYNSIVWNPLNAFLLKSLYSISLLSMQCNRSSGQRFDGLWEGAPLTHIEKPIRILPTPCF